MKIPFVRSGNEILYYYDNISVSISIQENTKTAFDFFITVIEKNRPDIIFTFFINSLIGELFYRYKHIPSVFFIHSNNFFRPHELEPFLRSYILKQKNFFVSSEFVRKSFFDSWGINPLVFPDFIEKEKYVSGTRKHEYITMINHNKVKGVDVFFNIASQLKEKKFLLVGNWTETDDEFLKNLSEHSNIKFIEPTDDMRSIYSVTSILLVPSLCAETFGRVITEAFFNGIPVLAYNSGALSQTMDGAGFCFEIRFEDNGSGSPDFDTSEWIEIIRKLDDNDYYNKVSRNCYEVSDKFYTKSLYICEQFRDFLENICKK